MSGSVRFNGEEFAYEEFEGEILVINLVEGTYFALGGSTNVFWEDLTSGIAVEQIASKLNEGSGTSEEEVFASLTSFVDQLVIERIVLSVDESAQLENGSASYSAETTYSPPVMEKHVDMQDLLTLDPIHDVDVDRGWPNA